MVTMTASVRKTGTETGIVTLTVLGKVRVAVSETVTKKVIQTMIVPETETVALTVSMRETVTLK